MKKTKNVVKQYAPYVALLALILTLINVGLGVMAMEALATSFLLPGLIVGLGFFSILMTIHSLNKFQFKHMQDLVWFSALIAILLFITATMAVLITPEIGFVYTTVQGFLPLLVGLVAGGVVAIVVGFLYLPGSKRTFGL